MSAERAKTHVASFHGGLHLEGHKEISTQVAIADIPLPKQLHIPVSQHIGARGKLLVNVGDKVLRGQPLTEADGVISAAVHASSSGVISAIESGHVANRSGQKELIISIDCDGQDQSVDALDSISAPAQDKERALKRLRNCGVVGLGGATFPTDVKLGTQKPITTLIINAVECEPYITCDDMFMREDPAVIIHGAELLADIVGADSILIGIEDNKPQAIAAMQTAVAESKQKSTQARVSIIVVPTIYPSGGEKQLIKLLTGKEVPSGGLPADLSIVCVNVATAAACKAALLDGVALTERIITVTGIGIAKPGNYRARLGTRFKDVLQHTGANLNDIDTVRMGGPLMGIKITSFDSPVVKASNCLLTQNNGPAKKEQVCIRCGDCVRVCPADLLPQQLYWHIRAGEFEKTEEHSLFDCIECGCCDYVCPSHIPLVDYYRYAKFEISTIKSERQRSDRARDRFEAREARLKKKADEKAALRAAKLKKLEERKAKDASGENASEDSKSNEIEAALARVKAKKKQQQEKP